MPHTQLRSPSAHASRRQRGAASGWLLLAVALALLFWWFHAAMGLPKGVAVVGVQPRSAADAAGIKPFQRGPAGDIITGDIITALGGKAIASPDELLEALERHQPGETVTLSVLRGGKPVELSVRLGLPE